MDPPEPSLFEVAEEYFKMHLGEPDGASLSEPRRLFWSAPEHGPHARMVRVELECDTTSGGVGITVADPTAPAPRRLETFTVHTGGQLDAALAMVLDHLAGS